MRVKLADLELEYGGPQLGAMDDANLLIDNASTMRARMEHDGYLLVRGLHSREKIEAARMTILEYLNSQGALDPAAPLAEGRINLAKGPSGGFEADFRAMSRYFSGQKTISDVVLAPERIALLERLLGGAVLAFEYRWLRLMGQGRSTPAHCDIIYMSLGTKKLYTIWTPFMDVPLNQGGLAVCAGSHKWHELRETYGAMDFYRDKIEGLFDTIPIEYVERWGGQWQTTEFKAGDILIFDAYAMHASTVNQTNRFRLSMDNRYQLASEPVDPRWMGEKPYTEEAYAMEIEPRTPLREAREKWGI